MWPFVLVYAAMYNHNCTVPYCQYDSNRRFYAHIVRVHVHDIHDSGWEFRKSVWIFPRTVRIKCLSHHNRGRTVLNSLAARMLRNTDLSSTDMVTTSIRLHLLQNNDRVTAALSREPIPLPSCTGVPVSLTATLANPLGDLKSASLLDHSFSFQASSSQLSNGSLRRSTKVDTLCLGTPEEENRSSTGRQPIKRNAKHFGHLTALHYTHKLHLSSTSTRILFSHLKAHDIGVPTKDQVQAWFKDSGAMELTKTKCKDKNQKSVEEAQYDSIIESSKNFYIV